MGRLRAACSGVALLMSVMSLTSANAALTTVTARLDAVNPNQPLELTVDNTFFVPSRLTTITIYAGRLEWDGSVATNPTPFDGNFIAYCIDFEQEANPTQTYTYEITPLGLAPTPNGANEGNPVGGSALSNGLGTSRSRETLLRQVWAEFYDTLGADPDRHAAFQMVLWKVLYEVTPGTYNDITTGSVRISGDISAAISGYANTYLAFLTDPLNAEAPTEDRLVALTSPTAQDIVVLIPEPSSLAWMTPLPLLIARRRR